MHALADALRWIPISPSFSLSLILVAAMKKAPPGVTLCFDVSGFLADHFVTDSFITTSFATLAVLLLTAASTSTVLLLVAIR